MVMAEARDGDGTLGTVLVVDDDIAIQRIVQRVLRDEGYRVVLASSAAEALAYLEATIDDVRLVLPDLTMPQMNGQELAERVQAEFPSLSVCAMSGQTDDPIAIAMMSGALPCL